MNTVISKDGTPIAYEKNGSGPVLLLVDGAFCRREFGPMKDLSKALSDRFTVVHYDRRGRGDSGDGAVYAVDREIEDINALVAAHGGEAFVYGCSSGAVLAARAVAAGGFKTTKLCVYEPPLALDGTHAPQPTDFIEQIARMIADDKRGDAVKLFMKVVGTPGFAIFMMSTFMPSIWKGLKSVAHTLPYDFAVLGDTQRGAPLPDELKTKLASITAPTLALSGGKSPRWLTHAAEVVGKAVRNGKSGVVPGQDHNVAAKAVAPVLVEFFVGAAQTRAAA